MGLSNFLPFLKEVSDLWANISANDMKVTYPVIRQVYNKVRLAFKHKRYLLKSVQMYAEKYKKNMPVTPE